MRTAIVLLLFSLLAAPPSVAQELDAQLETELLLGNDESAPAEYLFERPERISTDSKGNIYVADANNATVRVFTPEGKHLKTIGRRGKGPGEMTDISSVVVDPATDDLIVVDRMNHRITRFTGRGKDFTEYKVPEESIISAWHIRPLGNQKYVLYYGATGVSPEEKLKRGLLHVYDLSGEEAVKTASFAPPSDIWDLSKPFLRDRPGSPWSTKLETCGNSCVLFVPVQYEGTIYRYEKQAGSWQLTQKLKGKDPPYPSYKQIDKSYPTRAHTLISSGAPRVRIQSRSEGLHALKDGKIAHFTSMMNEEEQWIFGVELFTASGKYLGYSPLPEVGPEAIDEARSTYVRWIDENNRVYMEGQTEEGFPMIRIGRLTYRIGR